MLVTVFFAGLGIIYLMLTFIVIFFQFREDQENERLEKEATSNQIVLDDLDNPFDVTS